MSWAAIDTGPSDSWSSVVRPVVVNLSGVNGTTHAGTVNFTYIRALSRVTASTSVGTVGKTLAGLPSTAGATGALGEFIVYASPFITLDLTTLSLTGNTGTLGNQRTKALANRSGVGGVGTVGATVVEGGSSTITLGLINVTAVSSSRNLSETLQVATSSVNAVTNVETPGSSSTVIKALTTVPSSAAAGTAVYKIERPVTSVDASTAVGSPTDSITVALTGNSASAAAGTIVYLLRSVYNLTITEATGGAATLNYLTGAATNLNVVPTGTYIAGFTDITVTINAGVTIYSNDVTTPALTLFITEGYSLIEQDTLSFVNNGNIIGKGGNAGTYSPAPPYSPSVAPAYVAPQVGGDALVIYTYPLISGDGYLYITSFTNTGKIFAGGGGAGTGIWTGGGGGAGGGNGGVGLYYNYYSDFNYTAGGAGAVSFDSAGSNGTTTGTVGTVGTTPGTLAASGGGGGRNLTTTTGAAAVTDLWSGGVVATAGLGGNAGGSGAAFVTSSTRSAGGGGGGWGGRGGYGGYAGGNGIYTLTSGAGGSNASAGGNAFAATNYGATGGYSIYEAALSGDAVVTNTGLIYGFNTAF